MYKRQVDNNDIDSGGADQLFGDFQCLLSVIRLGNIPVSYTHLDVYKRQNQIRIVPEQVDFLIEQVSSFSDVD